MAVLRRSRLAAGHSAFESRGQRSASINVTTNASVCLCSEAVTACVKSGSDVRR